MPMLKEPWFTDRGIGTLPMPASIAGWASLAVFIVLLLATGLSHSSAMWPLRVVLGASFVALSFIKSDRGAR